MSSISEKLYIESASGLLERIARIDAIIVALEINMATITDQSGIEEYQLDDGQVRIKAIYRSASEIESGIERFDKLKQRLLNKLNGRQMVLRDWNGLKR